MNKKALIVTIAGFGLLMGGLLITGYLVRPRPLGGAWWSAYATDDYSLKYVCIRLREGQINPLAFDVYITDPFACESMQMDEYIKPLPSCTIEGRWQRCTEPAFDEWVQFQPQALEPGQFLDYSKITNAEEFEK